jgi:hypothetical protein
MQNYTFILSYYLYWNDILPEKTRQYNHRLGLIPDDQGAPEKDAKTLERHNRQCPELL